VLCALFLASVARFYHPGVGFTAFVMFPAGHDYELPALQALPHYEYRGGAAYDGQFYAQLAMEPLLRDPLIDRALDLAPYRARRILFSWTAYVLGLGRPAWILQVYALQNVFCWLILAWMITRWVPPASPRLFALWFASMFSHGLLASVRLALLDGPSLLLLTVAVLAAERRRRWATAATVGLAGLGRETNLLGAALLEWPRTRRDWLAVTAALLLLVAPLLLWQDYLWSIYRTTSLVGPEQLALPFTAYVRKVGSTIADLQRPGAIGAAGSTLLVVVALTVQAAYLAWRRALAHPWWRLAVSYAALMFIADPVVWDGYPGAITRVVLPLTFGFNMLLAGERGRFWPWCLAGNLHVIAALQTMPLPGLRAPF
jgi:hypothetical protein